MANAIIYRLGKFVFCKRYLLILFIFPFAYLQANVIAAGKQVNSDSAEVKIAKEPDWVTNIDLEQLSSTDNSERKIVQYQLVNSQTNITHRPVSRYNRFVMKPLSQNGLDTVSKIEIDYSPDYEKLIFHKITIARNGQITDRLNVDNIRIIQREEDIDHQIYDGRVSALIILDDIRIGDTLDYSYSIVGSNPVLGDKYYAFHSLGWNVPVDRVSIRLISPGQKKLSIKTQNIKLEPTRNYINGDTEYIWELADIKGIRDEEDYPHWYDPFPELQISEYQSWAEVTTWAEELYGRDFTLNDELNGHIQKIQSKASSSKEAALRALRFVQEQIRYFGIEFGVNSHLPSNPNEVYRLRYGDCKDKTLLLCAILQEMGVKSYPALVSTTYRRGIKDWLPSPGSFNHVIVKIEIGAQEYWVDPTRNYQGGDLESQGFVDYGCALLIGHKDKGLVHMARPAKNFPEINVDERYVVQAFHQPVELTIKRNYTSDMAEYKRRILLETEVEKIQKRNLDYHSSTYPSIKMNGNIEIKDDLDRNELTITEKYSIPDFWKRKYWKIYYRLNSAYIDNYISRPKVIKRTSPLFVLHPIKVRHKITLELPKKVGGKTPEENVKIEDDAVQYSRTAHFDGEVTTIVHVYESKANEVPVKQVSKHIQVLKAIDDATYYASYVTGIPMPAKRLTINKD